MRVGERVARVLVGHRHDGRNAGAHTRGAHTRTHAGAHARRHC